MISFLISFSWILLRDLNLRQEVNKNLKGENEKVENSYRDLENGIGCKSSIISFCGSFLGPYAMLVLCESISLFVTWSIGRCALGSKGRGLNGRDAGFTKSLQVSRKLFLAKQNNSGRHTAISAFSGVISLWYDWTQAIFVVTEDVLSRKHDTLATSHPFLSSSPSPLPTRRSTQYTRLK